MANLEQKYLLRMLTGPFSEADKHFKYALTTLKRLHSRGEVRRVTFEGDEIGPDDEPAADAYWEITDKGEARARKK